MVIMSILIFSFPLALSPSLPLNTGKDLGSLISNVGSGVAAAPAAGGGGGAAPAGGEAKEEAKEEAKKEESEEESDDDMGFGLFD